MSAVVEGSYAVSACWAPSMPDCSSVALIRHPRGLQIAQAIVVITAVNTSAAIAITAWMTSSFQPSAE